MLSLLWTLALVAALFPISGRAGAEEARRQSRIFTPLVSRVPQIKVTRGPYLQCGTPTSIIIRWRTDIMTASLVYFGTNFDALDSRADAPGSTTEHIVLLPELKPDTKYFYRLASSTNQLLMAKDTNSFFLTAPQPGTGKPTRVWVIGDSGTRRVGQWLVRDAYYKFTGTQHTDLWLMLGDNAYDDGRDQEFQESMFAIYGDLLRKSVCWPTFGNHEAYSANSATQAGVYYDIVSLPTQAQAGGVLSGSEGYYSFDYGNIQFVCLNSTGVDRSPHGRMLTWLKTDLAANHRDWTIAYWHHPPYSRGEHDSDGELWGDPRLGEMRTNALPILEAGGVDLVLNGHSHSYERSFLLDGHYGKTPTLTPAMKKDAGSGRIDGSGPYCKAHLGPAPYEGTVYIVAGCSGHLSWGRLNHPVMFTSALSLGSLVLDINGSRLDAIFLDDRGKKIDYFTIIKGPDTRIENEH